MYIIDTHYPPRSFVDRRAAPHAGRTCRDRGSARCSARRANCSTMRRTSMRRASGWRMSMPGGSARGYAREQPDGRADKSGPEPERVARPARLCPRQLRARSYQLRARRCAARTPAPSDHVAAPSPRHRSEQNFTASQSRAHFLRHANGRLHAAQILVGRSPLGTIFAIAAPLYPGRDTVDLCGRRRHRETSAAPGTAGSATVAVARTPPTTPVSATIATLRATARFIVMGTCAPLRRLRLSWTIPHPSTA